MTDPRQAPRPMPDDPAVALAEVVAAKLDVLTKRVTDERPKNGNGHVVVPRWVAVIATTVLAAAILGLFAFVLDISSRLAVRENVNVPARETEQRLMDHDRRLDRLERLTDGGRP